MAHGLPNLVPDYNGALVSTENTDGSCAVGQANYAREPRVGENRAVEVVEREAEDFLRELHSNKFFSTEAAFRERLQHVQIQIRSGSAEGVIGEMQETGMVGGTWTQTPQELEFGIRRAWRNSGGCIMPSCKDLKLCDLRSARSSHEMAMELVKAVTQAYNGGNITPTVFVFPPRTANNRGPMIWNDQLLSFAAYESEDGTIVGDPQNIQLTKDIIELGWVSPQPRNRWDVLPVVVMAENDEPVFVELPAKLRSPVQIRHPRYEAAFQKLDLKWVPFPALSRLGFDIGGVQYTATPVIGSFMDTEIGIRGLGNPLRYNLLPDLMMALYLDNKTDKHANGFESLATYELLAMLSRAQIELNYAIHYSFFRDGITMSDSFSAAKKWTQYEDNEFEKENEVTNPKQPPSNQSKSSICWHVQDPVKAWRVEKSKVPMDRMHSARAQSPMGPSSLECKGEGSVQREPVPTASRDVGEADPSVLDVEAHPSDDVPALEIPSADVSLDDIESPRTESASSTENLLLSAGLRSGSRVSSRDTLVGMDATPQTSPSIGADKLSSPVDVAMVAAWVHDSATAPQSANDQSPLLESTITSEKTFSASEVHIERLRKHYVGDSATTPQSASIDQPPLPESADTSEKTSAASQAHIERLRRHYVRDPTTTPQNANIEPESAATPEKTPAASHIERLRKQYVRDSVTTPQNANIEQPLLPASAVISQKTFAASKVLIERLKTHYPPSVTKDMWPVVFIPTVLLLTLYFNFKLTQ